MKSNKMLVSTILISSVFILSGCSNFNSKETSSKDNTPVNSETTVENNSIENKSAKKIDDTKDKTNTDGDSAKKETTSKTNKVAEDNSLTFKAKLGFSIKFPSNWKDRYTIKEDSNSMYVYFKSTDSNTPPNSGLLFLIMKKNDSINENMYDSIDGKKYITVGNTTYFIGGPTDIALNTENKDFKIFASMNKERKNVIDTISLIK